MFISRRNLTPTMSIRDVRRELLDIVLVAEGARPPARQRRQGTESRSVMPGIRHYHNCRYLNVPEMDEEEKRVTSLSGWILAR